MKYKGFCRLDCRGCADSICTECYAPELSSDRPTNADWNRWLQTGTRPVNIVVTDPARYLDTHAEGYAGLLGLLGSDGSWRVGAPSKIPYSGLGPASDAETTGEPEQHSVDPNGWLRRFALYENMYTSHWLWDPAKGLASRNPALCDHPRATVSARQPYLGRCCPDCGIFNLGAAQQESPE